EPTTPAGAEIVKFLEERGFPVGRLVLLGGRRTAGERVEFMGSEHVVEAAGPSSLDGVHVAFLACDPAMAEELSDSSRKAGCLAVDMSTRHNLDDDVPLVVPEVNGSEVVLRPGIVASPRPAVVELALVLGPIRKAVGIRRAVITSFHPVSEAGTTAMDELTTQIRDLFSFREASSRVFPHQTAFNVIPAVGRVGRSGVSQEEAAVASEIRKVLGDADMRVSVTCVRVPAFYANCASVTVETGRKVGPAHLREILREAAGVLLKDDPPSDVYPTPVDASGMDECLVGRIRSEEVFENAVSFFAACDNVRRGGALNALLIAEKFLQEGNGTFLTKDSHTP
ncbi:MAG TPA: aspartate-semialdehyde dehydrogenase, partial [Deltaproteobacteria bacterium]|nr:aspartate-semialdehyde dehydrogenase [Deltaproteobacteria bacterium]